MTTNIESGEDEITHVTINLPALLLSAEQALKETAQFVAFGLAAAELAEPDDIRLPGSLIAIGHGEQVSIPTLRSEYGDWLVGLCLRRYIEVHNTFLEKVGQIARLIEFQREPFHYDSEQVGQEFNKLGLPDKLDHISRAFGLSVDSELRVKVESLNRARNCYEHGRRKVRERDLRGMDSFVVSWLGADAVRVATSGTESLVTELPVIIGPGEGFKVTLRDRTKSFNLGEELRSSPADVSEMGLTFLQHSNELVGATQQALEIQN